MILYWPRSAVTAPPRSRLLETHLSEELILVIHGRTLGEPQSWSSQQSLIICDASFIGGFLTKVCRNIHTESQQNGPSIYSTCQFYVWSFHSPSRQQVQDAILGQTCSNNSSRTENCEWPWGGMVSCLWPERRCFKTRWIAVGLEETNIPRHRFDQDRPSCQGQALRDYLCRLFRYSYLSSLINCLCCE